jgi:hypothetical protein
LNTRRSQPWWGTASSSRTAASSSPNPGKQTINTRDVTEIKPHSNMIQEWLLVLVIHRRLSILPWNNARGLTHKFFVMVFWCPFGPCTLPFSGHGLCPLSRHSTPNLIWLLLHSLFLHYPWSFQLPLAPVIPVQLVPYSIHFCFSLSI